jgi:hypothetical protein
MNINNIIQNLAESGGVWNIGQTVTSVTTTAATSTSGNISFQLLPLSTTTFTGTLADANYCGATDQLMQSLEYANTAGTNGGVARIYKVGTATLGSIGSTFTHVSGTFPLTRTVMGQANAAVSFIPFVRVNATLGTAPEFTIDYIANDGTAMTGTLTTELPASAVAGSCFFLRLEDQGSAAQDITDLIVSTTSTAGSLEIYMMELMTHGQDVVVGASIYDTIVGSGGRFTVMVPADPTAGTIDSWMVLVNYSTIATDSAFITVGFA